MSIMYFLNLFYVIHIHLKPIFLSRTNVKICLNREKKGRETIP